METAGRCDKEKVIINDHNLSLSHHVNMFYISTFWHRLRWERPSPDLPRQCPPGPAIWGCSAPRLPDTETWRWHEAHSAGKHHLWKKKQKQNWIKNGFIIDSFEWKWAETHHYSIFVCVTDAWAEVGVEPTVCDPVNCGGASARPWSFHLRSASHCSVRAPNDWTEVKKRDRQIGWIIFRTFRTTNQILIS